MDRATTSDSLLLAEDNYRTQGHDLKTVVIRRLFKCLANRAVQWHYIEKLSNDTVPNHTLITTNHQALFIYNPTQIAG